MKHMWEWVDGRYLISNKGVVLNAWTGRRIKPWVTRGGYEQVHLCTINGRVGKTIHSLVAKAFIPNPNNFYSINHKDGDKLNNSVNNLEYCSLGDNIRHAHKTGLVPSRKGSNCGSSKLTEEQVRDIKVMLQTDISQKDISKLFNVEASTISQINRGFSWSHIKI